MSTGTEIAARIAKPVSLSKKEKSANKERVKELAGAHLEKAMTELGKLVVDRRTPASAKVQAIKALVERVAGTPRVENEQQTEASELEKKTPAELLQYITEQVAPLPSQARQIIASCAVKGVAFDALDLEDELAPELRIQELPPLVKPKKEVKVPRR